jgi:hypothetical protein
MIPYILGGYGGKYIEARQISISSYAIHYGLYDFKVDAEDIPELIAILGGLLEDRQRITQDISGGEWAMLG